MVKAYDYHASQNEPTFTSFGMLTFHFMLLNLPSSWTTPEIPTEGREGPKALCVERRKGSDVIQQGEIQLDQTHDSLHPFDFWCFPHSIVPPRSWVSALVITPASDRNFQYVQRSSRLSLRSQAETA